jgi:hypothetical protein
MKRGQATVEMALGLLVFITVVAFGIHFAEVTFLSMKVTEAAGSAFYDTTAGHMHSVMFNYDTGSARRNAELSATTRYAGWDGRQAAAAGPPGVQDVFTVARNMQVRCPSGGAPIFPALPPATAMYWGNWGGENCSATADMAAINFPERFMDQGGGFFTVQNYNPPSLHICAAGRALGGDCTGGFSSMLDDWGLANTATENWICPSLPFGLPCPNLNYWTGVQAVYQLNGGSQGMAAKRLAQSATLMSVPINVMGELTGYMSFTGSEMLFQQPLIVGEGAIVWETTPFLLTNPAYFVSWIRRSDCYLGLDCN